MDRSKTLVTGWNGLVGSRFVELSSFKDSFILPGREEFDLTNSLKVKSFVSKNRVKTIVNFAAFTDVAAAENERENKKGLCWRVNVEGVKNLIRSLNPDKAHLIHISTDMVFSGLSDNPGPYSEEKLPEDDLKKLTWYGFTKAEGERVLLNTLGERATILRLIYPVRAEFDQKSDYLRKPLQLYDEGKLYPLFNDQKITISFIDEIALAIDRLLETKMNGIFHASSSNTTTPYELISYFLKKVRGVSRLKEHRLDEFLLKTGAPAYRYPKFGGLKVEKTEKELKTRFSNWRQIVDKLVEQGVSV